MDGSGQARRVTLADVAASVGVSRATASRALADDPRISPATRGAVHDAAVALRYVPNAAARSLRLRRTRTLGLLLADLSDPVHGQVAAGFELEAAREGYRVIFVAGGNVPDRERRAIGVFVEHRVDGIALVSSVLDPREARELAGAEHPLVVVQPDHPGILRRRAAVLDGLIQTDDSGGVEEAARHLLDVGRRSIQYLGAGGRGPCMVRGNAVRRVLEGADLAPLPDVILGDDAWRDPRLVASAVVSPRPDAVVCYDDKLALALLDGLRGRGIRVPEDIAVTGFDGIPFAALSNPRLTTVSTPTTEMGRAAAHALARAITDGRLPPGQVLATRLVIRESTLASAPDQGAVDQRTLQVVTGRRRA